MTPAMSLDGAIRGGPSSRPNGAWVEAFAVLAIGAVVGLITEIGQRPIEVQGGRGMDGVEYHRVAEQLRLGQRPTAAAPYVYRLGTPALAAWLEPADLIWGFGRLNQSAALIAAILLVRWLRPWVASACLRVVLGGLFLSHWLAPLRFHRFYPVLTDGPALVFLLTGLLAIQHWRHDPSRGARGLLGALVLIGVLFKESVLLIGLAWLADQWHGRGRRRPPSAIDWLPLAGGLLGLLATHLATQATNDYSYLRTAWHWLGHKPWWTYPLAWWIAFGPVLVLALWDWRRGLELLRRRFDLVVVLGGGAAAALLAGSNTERILYGAVPVATVLIGRALERAWPLLRRRPAVLVLLVAVQGIAQRWFWSTPDPGQSVESRFPWLTPWGGAVPYRDLTSVGGAGWVAAAMLAEYLVLAAFLWLWLQRSGRRASTAEPSGAETMLPGTGRES
jgi:hypothetical protein